MWLFASEYRQLSDQAAIPHMQNSSCTWPTLKSAENSQSQSPQANLGRNASHGPLTELLSSKPTSSAFAPPWLSRPRQSKSRAGRGETACPRIWPGSRACGARRRSARRGPWQPPAMRPAKPREPVEADPHHLCHLRHPLSAKSLTPSGHARALAESCNHEGHRWAGAAKAHRTLRTQLPVRL